MWKITFAYSSMGKSGKLAWIKCVKHGLFTGNTKMWVKLLLQHNSLHTVPPFNGTMECSWPLQAHE